MRKLIALATGLVCLGGVTYFLGTAWGQNKAAPVAELPHKTGLIDMGVVFNEYKKFAILREDLKAEFAQSEAEAKARAEKLQALVAEAKSGTFKEGSPEFLNREKEFIRLNSEFETFKKITTQDMQRKEAKIYQQIYLEVQDAVVKFSDAYKYTLIIRFSRDEMNSTDPQKIIQGLQRQVVHFRPDDDITDSVIEFLNRKYSPAKTSPATATPPKITSPGTPAKAPVKTATPPSATKKN